MLFTQGHVVSVVERAEGDELDGDHTTGATALVVTDAYPFSEGGGSLSINGDVYAYAEDAVDDDASTIVLTSALVDDYSDGTRVEILPVAPEKVAQVVLDGGGQSVPARVLHHLDPFLPVGIREPDQQESVELLSDERGDYRVFDVLGRPPVMDGAAIDPETLPPAPPVAPATSPAVKVTGTAEALIVEADPVDPSVLLQYHLSDDPAFVPVLDDPTTLVSPVDGTRSSVFVALVTPADGLPLVLGSTYYVRTIAFNDAGLAAPGVVSNGTQLDPTMVSEIIVSRLVSGFILAGGIQVGNILIDPDSGITIPQPGGQSITFPADGTAARIAGVLYAFALVVEGGLSLRGQNNVLEAGTRLGLSRGVTTPTSKPTVGRTWTAAPMPESGDAFESTFYGLCTSVAAGDVVTAQAFFGGSLRVYNATTGAAVTASAGIADWNPVGGVTRIGTNYYGLGYDTSRENRWFVKRFNSSLVETAEWEYTDEAAGGPRDPAIGTDGTDVLVARANTSAGVDRIVVRKFYPSTGAAVPDSVVICPIASGAKTDLRSVYQGDYDVGYTVNRLIVSTETTIYTFSSTGTRLPAFEWSRAGGARVRGLAWDGTRFRHIDNTARLWQYGTVTTDTSRVVDYSWYDSDAGGTGVHETNRGPATTFTQIARSLLTVQTPPPNDTGEPDAPDSVRIWIGGQRQADLGAGVVTATYDAPSTGTTTKAASFATAGLTASEIYDDFGNSWKGSGQVVLPGLIQAGKKDAVFGGSSITSVAVTFPTPFAAPPIVVATPEHTGSFFTTLSSITTTGFTAYVRLYTGGSTSATITVDWIATPAS